MKKALAALAMVLVPAPALATTVTFDLPGTEPSHVQTLSYDCSGRTVRATYITTETNALAVLDLDDAAVVTVAVLAGSGAKYVGQQYVWWTKGDVADLYDLTQSADTPLAHCRSAG